MGTTKVHGRRKYCVRQVFTDDEETALAKYFTKAADVNYGLTYDLARDLAYQYAKHLNKKYPSSLDEKKTTGKDWMKSFMKRHEGLSLRKPENTSLQRLLSFNWMNVELFFNNYISLMEKHQFPPDRIIINLDETGVNTVMPSPRIIAPSRRKQVGATTSQERGEQTTVVGIVGATGNAMPPVYTFPRVNMKAAFLDGTPSGSLGLSSNNNSVFLAIHVDDDIMFGEDEKELCIHCWRDSRNSLI